MSGIKRVIPDQAILNKVKRIHLTAICGTGMGSLAGLLVEQGFSVTGSDKDVYPPMSTQLKRLGIELHEGYDAKLLDHTDLIIIGNAISRGNVELEYALEKHLPILSLPEALQQFFLAKRKSIIVAGTHGKTTTSAMASFLLEACGKSPGFFVGGILANYNQSCRLGNVDSPFVVEGDEYDSACFDKRAKIVHFTPDTAILTSIEFDHADIYENVSQIKNVFRNFISQMPADRMLVACAEDPLIREILPSCRAEVIRYGFAQEAVYRAEEVEQSPKGTTFALVVRGKRMGVFHSPLLGLYNLQNLLAVLATLERYGVTAAEALGKMKDFKNVYRRQQVRGVEGGVTLIDDFAHHPTAVRVTLEGLRQGYPQGSLWVIFEPRTASSRRKIFQEQYASSFDAADEIIIAGVFKVDALKQEERFSSEELVSDLKARGKKAFYIPQVQDIVKTVSEEAKEGDTVVIMSNGGFGGIHDKLLTVLKGKNR